EKMLITMGKLLSCVGEGGCSWAKVKKLKPINAVIKNVLFIVCVFAFTTAKFVRTIMNSGHPQLPIRPKGLYFALKGRDCRLKGHGKKAAVQTTSSSVDALILMFITLKAEEGDGNG